MALIGSVRRARGLITIVVIGVLMLGVIAQPAGASPPKGKNPQAALCGGKPTDPDPVECTSKVKGAQGIAGSIATSLAGAVAKSLLGFALNQTALGKIFDPTDFKLDQLKTQLGVIQNQLNTLQLSVDSISAELQKLALQGYLVPLEGIISKIKSLNDGFFAPTLRAETAWADADRAVKEAGLTCDEVKACDDKHNEFVKQRGFFFDAVKTPESQDLNNQIHAALIPNSIGQSVMRAYGAYLLNKPKTTGILTRADSDLVYSFYNYFAEYEALAVWMKAEWKGAVQFDTNPTEFDLFVKAEITDRRAVEEALRPPRIPGNTFIVLNPDPARRTKTKDQPMFLWDPKIGGNLVWDPSFPAGTATLPSSCIKLRSTPTPACAVDAAINTFNVTDVGDITFHDWHVPSRTEVDALFTGQIANFPTNSRGFLLRILPNNVVDTSVFDNNISTYGFLWTSEPAGVPSTSSSPAYDCNRPQAPILVGRITGYAHTAIRIGMDTIRNYPAGYPLTNVPDLGPFISGSKDTTLTQAQYLQVCRNFLATRVTNHFAGPPGFGFEDRRGAQLFPVRMTTVDYLVR